MSSSERVAMRRSYARFQVENASGILNDGQSERVFLIKDISALGMGLVTDNPLEHFKVMRFEIKPNFFLRTGASRQGKVVWCNKIKDGLWEAGVDFGVGNELEFV